MIRRSWIGPLRLAGELLVVAILASIVTFVAVRVLPGDPARAILGRSATEGAVDAERRALGLDRPLIAQYFDWLGQAFRGDFGRSLASRQPVAGILADTLPITLVLVCSAVIVATTLGVGLATLAVRRPGAIVDRAITTYAVLTSALPSFAWGLALVIVFALTLRLLPSSGYVNPFVDPIGGVRYLVLPVLALSVPATGVLARISRAALLESLASPSIEFARAKGLPRRRVLYVHALKLSAVPILTVVGSEFAYTLGDTVAVEVIFGIPGAGKLLVNSFSARDYPVIQGTVLMLTVFIVCLTFLFDLLAARVDPRVALSLAAAS